jgi:N-acetylglucosaminyl-diphospho-decaprenol L-rhamnosyltransferase
MAGRRHRAVDAREVPVRQIVSRWAAVVVNYEAGHALTRCVQSLLADTSAGAAPHVVVVDNGSSDGSTATIDEAPPAVTVLNPGKNLGYARAANLGIGATDASVIAICNPDLEVEAGTAAAILSRLAAEPDLAAAGPLIRNPDGSIYPSARSVPRLRDAVGHGLLGLVWRTNPFTRRYRQLDADPRRPRDVDWVSGAAIWLRRDALTNVGGWDERYFMYVEDVDLCWRLRNAGWRIGYEPGGTVTHVQGAATAKHPYRMIVEHHRSLFRFAAKRWRGPKRVALPFAAVFLTVRAGLAMAEHALRRRPRPPQVTG